VPTLLIFNTMIKTTNHINVAGNRRRRAVNRKSAFTLVEMLLVASLFSVISLAVFNAFANGLKIWERGCRPIIEEDISLFFEKLEGDLRNYSVYSHIGFDGKPGRITFATIVSTLIDQKKVKGVEEAGYAKEIGRVEYYFDENRRNLYRRQANFSQALKNKFGPDQPILKSIESVTFQYGYKTNRGYVIENKGKDAIPSFVLVDIKFKQGQGIGQMKKVISIPVGN